MIRKNEVGRKRRDDGSGREERPYIVFLACGFFVLLRRLLYECDQKKTEKKKIKNQKEREDKYEEQESKETTQNINIWDTQTSILAWSDFRFPFLALYLY